MTKLADLRAAATYQTVTKEMINDLRTSKNAKKVFDCMNFDYNDKTYTNVADSILFAVENNCSGFVVDIAKRFRMSTFPMSEKQTWCIAFAFIKIENEITSF